MAKAKSASPSRNARDLARDAERAHVELRVQPAEFGRHDGLEETRLAQRRNARAAGRVDVVMRQAGQRGVGPARQRLGETAVIVVEERPG